MQSFFFSTIKGDGGGKVFLIKGFTSAFLLNEIMMILKQLCTEVEVVSALRDEKLRRIRQINYGGNAYEMQEQKIDNNKPIYNECNA